MPTRKPVTAAEAYAAAATRAVHLAEGIVQHLVAVQDKIDPGDVDWADVGTRTGEGAGLPHPQGFRDEKSRRSDEGYLRGCGPIASP